MNAIHFVIRERLDAALYDITRHEGSYLNPVTVLSDQTSIDSCVTALATRPELGWVSGMPVMFRAVGGHWRTVRAWGREGYPSPHGVEPHPARPYPGVQARGVLPRARPYR